MPTKTTKTTKSTKTKAKKAVPAVSVISDMRKEFRTIAKEMKAKASDMAYKKYGLRPLAQYRDSNADIKAISEVIELVRPVFNYAISDKKVVKKLGSLAFSINEFCVVPIHTKDDNAFRIAFVAEMMHFDGDGHMRKHVNNVFMLYEDNHICSMIEEIASKVIDEFEWFCISAEDEFDGVR